MHLYKLRAEDMQPPEVPHALDANPINPQWHLMELYRRPDVVRQALHLGITTHVACACASAIAFMTKLLSLVRAAIRKYGGVEQMWAHRQPSAVSC